MHVRKTCVGIVVAVVVVVVAIAYLGVPSIGIKQIRSELGSNHQTCNQQSVNVETVDSESVPSCRHLWSGGRSSSSWTDIRTNRIDVAGNHHRLGRYGFLEPRPLDRTFSILN